MKLPVHFFSYLLMLSLTVCSLTAQGADRDTVYLEYALGAPTENAADSVTVDFTITLKYLGKPELDSDRYPHYNIIVFYGDGTFEKNIIIDTALAAGNIEFIPPNSDTPDSIVYQFSHTYYRKPNRILYASVAKSKTTDVEPPPKIDTLNIPKWIELATSEDEEDRLKLPSTQLIIADSLAQLVRPAGEKQFNLPSDDDPEIAENIQLDFHLAPVPNNDYIGIIDLKGVSSTVKEGAIYMHYNLTDFADTITLESYKVRSWQNETISEPQLFRDFYQITGDNNSVFKNVISIGFNDLDSGEIRRYVFPFECPASLTGNFDDPVFFHVVVLDSSAIAPYVQGVGDIIRNGGDIINITSIIEPAPDPGVEVLPGSKGDSGRVRDMIPIPDDMNLNLDFISAPNQSMGGKANSRPTEFSAYSVFAPTTLMDDPDSGKKLIQTQNPEPSISEEGTTVTFSYTIENSDEFQQLLDGLTGEIIGQDEHMAFVRRSHDPNSIVIDPTEFCFSPKELGILINVQNYGLTGAKRIRIKLEYPKQMVKDTFLRLSHSFGKDAEISTSHFSDGGKRFYEIIITNIYLPGLLELAEQYGDLVIDGNTGELKPPTYTKNKYASISQGNIVLTTTTKRIYSSTKELILKGEVYFDEQAPVLMRDTTTYKPTMCGGVGAFLHGGVRLGYNYFFPFEQFEPNFNPIDNFSAGLFFDFSPFSNTRLYYRLEGNYNRWGFKDNDLTLRQENFEVAFMARYAISRRFSIGIGPSYLISTNWEFVKEDQTPPVPFSSSSRQVGGLLDAAFALGNDRTGRIGLRAHYYPNALEFPANELNVFGLQAYLAFRIFD